MDLTPGERAGFLRSACGGDGRLEAEIESLCAADSRSPDAISRTLEFAAAAVLDGGSLAGERLGPYRIEREIGRGGMGAVYLAVRADDQFRKNVAIKVVKLGMDTAEVVARFRHERQILASLDHPYIARILDGGTTPDGRPFFVMDYVEGQPLDEYVRVQSLNLRARCDLFLKVLEAVSYAHRNLVVHRDLKPGNILVTAGGAPKLLDFGVAKLITPEPLRDATVNQAFRTFTPEYASPEQARGSTVSTSTDVYSLGAVLFELLTGRRAVRIASHSPVEIERAICEREVEHPRALAAGIPADLDHIVLKAMRKEPERRYQSAHEFGKDVRAWLDGRPVSASPDSFTYRAAKLLRRHRIEAVSVAAVIVSLVAALAGSITETHRTEAAFRTAQEQFRQAEISRSNEAHARQSADEQRNEALLQRGRAEQRLNEMIEIADKNLFEAQKALTNLPGTVEARQRLVGFTLAYLEKLEKEYGLDDRMRFTLGGAYVTVAELQGSSYFPSLGDFAGAAASYRKAEALLEPLHTRDAADAQVVKRWVIAEQELGSLKLQNKEAGSGRSDLEHLLPEASRLARLLPRDSEACLQEPLIHERLANGVETPEGLNHSARAAAILEPLTRRFPEAPEIRSEYGASLSGLATHTKFAGDLPAAASYFRRSIEIREQLLKAQPKNADVERGLAIASANYATLLGIPWSVNLGQYDEARKYARKAVDLTRELAMADSLNKNGQYDLAISLSRLGMIPAAPGGAQDSLRSLEEALGILEPIGKANPKSRGIVSQLGTTRNYAGKLLMGLGRWPEAKRQFQRCLAELDFAFTDGDRTAWGTGETVCQIGLASGYTAAHEREPALDAAAAAVRIAEKTAAEHAGIDSVQRRLGEAYAAQAGVFQAFRDAAKAAEYASKAVAILKHGVKDLSGEAVDALHSAEAILAGASSTAAK